MQGKIQIENLKTVNLNYINMYFSGDEAHRYAKMIIQNFRN